MTNKEYIEISRCNEWMSIDYLTYASKGHIIMKKKYYELYQKKIERKLKGLTYWINYDYKLTLEEFINFDELLEIYKRKVRCHEERLKYYILRRDSVMFHNYENPYDKDVKEYEELISLEKQQIEERKQYLIEEYKRKEENSNGEESR